MVARPENYRELQQQAGLSFASDTNRGTETQRNISDEGSALAALASQLLQQQHQQASNPTAGTIRPTTDSSNETQNEPSLEHIRQGFLTLRTLMSTMPTAHTGILNPVVESDSKLFSSEKGDETKQETKTASPRRVTDFFVGQWLDVKDTVSQWLEATVMDVSETQRTVFIHYNGWLVKTPSSSSTQVCI